MRFNLQHFIRAIILAAFAAFFIKLHYTDDIAKYINPKYNLMSQIAAGIFVFLFLIQLFRVWEDKNNKHECCSHGCNHHDHHSSSFPKRFVSHVIIIFPLVTGFAFAPATLDASIAAKKGTMFSQNKENQDNFANQQEQSGNIADDTNKETSMFESSEPSADMDDSSTQVHQTPLPNNNFLSEEKYDEAMKRLKASDTIQMSENIYAPYYQAISKEPDSYKGRKIKIKGFVYKENEFGSNQLVISRFLMTHCVADASVIGLLTEMDQANELAEDTWIEIEGVLDITNYNSEEIPIIKAEKVEVIEEPSDPYIYPVMMKLDL